MLSNSRRYIPLPGYLYSCTSFIFIFILVSSSIVFSEIVRRQQDENLSSGTCRDVSLGRDILGNRAVLAFVPAYFNRFAAPPTKRWTKTRQPRVAPQVCYASNRSNHENEATSRSTEEKFDQKLEMNKKEESKYDVDDDSLIKPYRNRSLSWTHRYRSVVPYETARLWVMELGLRSKAEWDEYVAEGKVFHGAYLPNHPDEMYADEWVSWEEFLGLMRSYDDTRNIVQNVLGIHTMEEYMRFIEMHPKRAEGLRIPAKPDVVYRDKGWIGEEHFFGTWK